MVVQQPPEKHWHPGIAAVLSFFIPGLGQIYRGKILRGLLWMGATAVGLLAAHRARPDSASLCIINAYVGNPYKR
ncbi:MAG: hypothetical protein IPH10_08135 [bacterium]|nr:hypothetical protein [bacterium]